MGYAFIHRCFQNIAPQKSLYATLTKMLSNKQYEQEMKQHLIETIQRIERENAGVVPPAFVKK